MSKIKFIYFDIGGVFLNFFPFFEFIAKESDQPFETVLEVFKKHDPASCRGILTTAQLWERYQKELGFSHLEGNFEKYFTQYSQPLLATHTFAEEISKTHNIGLLTNILTNLLHDLFTHNLVPKLDYQSIIESCEEGFIKPEKEIFEIAQKRCGMNPEEILFTDDNGTNIEAAKNLGWNTVLFDTKNPEASLNEIKELLK